MPNVHTLVSVREKCALINPWRRRSWHSEFKHHDIAARKVHAEQTVTAARFLRHNFANHNNMRRTESLPHLGNRNVEHSEVT